MTETIVCPPTSTVTSAMRSPVFTAVTVPLSWLRALSSTVYSLSVTHEIWLLCLDMRICVHYQDKIPQSTYPWTQVAAANRRLASGEAVMRAQQATSLQRLRRWLAGWRQIVERVHDDLLFPFRLGS